ncbi:DUF2125 domain-containing protein [Lichenicoccus roseus]|nr:DUF2125 domain-containing protein [Lichenicoccus roseus]
MRRNQPLRIVLAVAIALIAVDTLGWIGGQFLLDRQISRLDAEAAANGWKLDRGTPSRGGWPLAVTRTFTKPVLRPGSGQPGPVWTGDAVTVGISVLRPTVLGIRLIGGQVIAPAGTDLRHALRFRGTDLEVVLPMRGHAGTPHTGELEFKASRLRVASPAGILPSPGVLADVSDLDGRMRWTDAAHAITLTARGIVLSTPLAVPGLSIPAGSLEMSLTGGSAVGGGGQGSRLMLANAGLRWPDARADLAGTATLDGKLLADGGFSLHVVAPDRLLDHLTQAGLLSAAQAVPVRAVIGLLQDARGAAQRDILDLPLTLHGGLLSLGRLPLMQIPAAGGLPHPMP